LAAGDGYADDGKAIPVTDRVENQKLLRDCDGRASLASTSKCQIKEDDATPVTQRTMRALIGSV
jgi:hypothetical protein